MDDIPYIPGVTHIKWHSHEVGFGKPGICRYGLAEQLTSRFYWQLDICRCGPGTQKTERSSTSHMPDVIGLEAYLVRILMAVTIGGGMGVWDCVIT